MLSLSNAQPVTEETPEVVSCPGYPLKENNAPLQLHELLDDYNRIQITNINAAFFFCRPVENEQGNISIKENTTALKEIAKAIITNTARNPQHPSQISFVLDEDIFKNPEAFAEKYANRRPEYTTDKNLAKKLLNEEATIIRKCLSDSKFLEDIFTEAMQEMKPEQSERSARIFAKGFLKGRIIGHGQENGRATEIREYPIAFQLAKMPEKGLEYPSWLAQNTATEETLVAIQNASPATDKMNRQWVFAPDGITLEKAFQAQTSVTKHTATEQETALVNTLNPANVKAAIKSGEESVTVNDYLKSHTPSLMAR